MALTDPLRLSQPSPMMGYTTNERNQRVKHISEMFEGGTVEEQVHNLFTTVSFWNAPTISTSARFAARSMVTTCRRKLTRMIGGKPTSRTAPTMYEIHRDQLIQMLTFWNT